MLPHDVLCPAARGPTFRDVLCPAARGPTFRDVLCPAAEALPLEKALDEHTLRDPCHVLDLMEAGLVHNHSHRKGNASAQCVFP